MQTYITQLLEILKEAQNNRPLPRYLELPEEIGVIELERSLDEDEATMENLLGVPQYYFPPENLLTEDIIE